MARLQSLRASLPGLGRLARRFWPYLKRERSLVAFSLVTLYADVALRLLEPWPLKVVLDRIVATMRGHTPHRLAALNALDPAILLGLAAVAVIALAVLRAVAQYYNTVGVALVGNRVLTSVRDDLYNQRHRLSLLFHTRARTEDLPVRVTGDIGFLQDVVVTAFLPLLANALTLLGMAAVMLWMNARLTLIVFATGPLFWLSTVRISRRIQETGRRQRQQEGAMAATAKVIRALERIFAQAFTGQSRKNLATGVVGTRLSAGLQRTVASLIAIAAALVLLFGASSALRGAVTAGDLVVFLAYLRTAFRPMRDLAKYTGRLAKASAAGERVLDLLDQVPDVRDLPGAVPAPPLRGAVRFEGVSFAYEPGRPALDQIDCVILPGQHVALMGPSGSGKTSFVSLILRLYDPTGGRVLINGRDIRDYTLASLRAQISVVLQDSLLFAASIADNIAYGSPGAPREAVEAAARLANAHSFITALPQGYDSGVGERGVTLSNGQRQRIAIARAAIRRAPILILDEPTTGLDRENAQAVADALERLALGRTTFLITHDADLAARAHRILYIDAGRLREMASPPRYDAVNA